MRAREWIGIGSALLTLTASSACCPATTASKIARPDRPSYEFVGAPERTWSFSPSGTAVPSYTFTEDQLRAIGRNLEKRSSYERRLEMAPFWEGQ